MTEATGPAENGASAPTRQLPTADSHRWKPLRSGLLNLYRYDDDEFWFEQGRLLLRGNNGTGKSRVLALQLPFLLDGEVAPHRLEPDGDPAKRVEWNLLMGKHTDRTGYTWLEFGRLGDDGTPWYLTLGCGLAAAEGRGLVGKWHFITDMRIGEELFLTTPEGYPLVRERLIERLSGRGHVFTTAAKYRAAVDTALFKLGEHRYSALVGLLIQLRQPQLSRQLDEKRLSAALGEALRPLSKNVVDDVADAFRSLESDRTSLEAFIAARAGADAFLGEYRRYARIAARRSADRVRGAHAAYETTMRKLRAAESALETAAREHDTIAALVEQLGVDEVGAASTVATLRGSPEMRTANELHTARQMATDRLGDSERASDAVSRARTSRSASDAEHVRVAEKKQRSRLQLDESGGKARACASAAGVDRDHDAGSASLFAQEGAGAVQIVNARRRLQEITVRRQQASRHVRDLNATLIKVRAEYESAKEAHAASTTKLDRAVDAHRASGEAHDVAVTSLIVAFREWVASLQHLALPDVDAIADALVEWCLTTDGKSPLSTAAASAANLAASAFASLRADAQHRLAGIDARLADLSAERRRLEGGHHTPPVAPHTRGERVREARGGAPLWRLCDFRSEAARETRACLEAALEASGLLDAWVMPDGRLLAADEHDTLLVGPDAGASLPDRHVGMLIGPAIDRADRFAAEISNDTVERLLRQIGLGADSGNVWVDDDGRWRVGPLRGQWQKQTAEHIGESAREAARRARLDELQRELLVAEQQRGAVDEELSSIMHSERAARAELDAVPDDGGVRAALAQLTASRRQLDALREEVAVVEAHVIDRRGVVDERLGERDRAAADLAVTPWVDDLARLDDAIADYRTATGDLVNIAERYADLVEQTRAAAERAATATGEEERAQDILEHANRAAAEAVAVRDTMEATAGAAVAEVLARLDLAERELKRVRGDKERAAKEHSDLRVRVAEAKRDIDANTELLERDAAIRQIAIAGLEAFARTGLLATCDPALGDVDVSGAVTRTVDAARRIEAALASVTSDDEAWGRSQRQIFTHVQTLTNALLPYGYDPATERTDDGIVVVTASFQGRRCSIAELREQLAEEITSRQSLLDAREREILENHLVGEVAQHLHELLREGERWVTDMNRELHDRPMSTGLTLRFRWEPAEDGPEEFPEIRRHLLRAGATWSAADRASLGAFLQRRIQIIRAANETGTWQEHLATALDYRGWHQFSVERQQDGHWKRLTRRTHGTGSGGEKAILLTIPQFAAAAAHYRSADPSAPRLILLDEAFVGIDTDMRSKCMGLLHTFDLDFVMTSEREWGCYATLPGVAIYQLATRPGIDAVGLTRWVWNGQQRVRSDTPARPPNPATRVADPTPRDGGNGQREAQQEELTWPT